MESSTKTDQQIAYLPIVTAVGGFLAFVGVFLKWFNAAGIKNPGTDDWTGSGVMVLGIVVIFAGLAAIIVKDSGTKKTAGLAAMVGGFLVVFFCIMALTRLDSIYEAVKSTASAGLWVSLFGGVVGAIGGIAFRNQMSGEG